MNNLDLNKMEQQLDDALASETKESLTDWLIDQRVTDIQKMIEEGAISYIESIAPSDPNFDISLLRPEYDAFIDGANFALSHIQHANRWIKVSEELPEVIEKDYQVLGLLKNGEYKTIWVIKDGITQNEVFSYHGVTEWKPIN
ncbi:hypothetical protein IR083_21015 [Dysgonomonas sp. GY75]|uniref:hypothetical protein n=1 Tax=Dysgonomonas sp. GY75 TaxID=2780419 RepID=UPI0018840DBC|nr:hypothetical protein [Dysgonomonas sp. GY75]MBF0651303.1 hypothetical protein [Dysgonomonas sp. GY75]